jgi:hypothetical protein
MLIISHLKHTVIIYIKSIDLILYFVSIYSFDMNNIVKNDASQGKPPSQESLPAWLQLVREHVRSLKFGTVQITVHDSRVVQVERVEKLRFDNPEQSKG